MSIHTDKCCEKNEKLQQNVVYEAVKKKYANLLKLIDFGYCEPKFYENSLHFDTDTYFLGCGNISEIAQFNKGETVLDLGCGCGHDCFIAAEAVGETGQIIGLDLVPQMLERAREIALKKQMPYIQFIEGKIEEIPLESQTVDIVISNCVINLSADKSKAYSEIARVLKKGGRIAISDIICVEALDISYKDNEAYYCSCLSGALDISSLNDILKACNFKDIVIKMEHLPIDVCNEEKLYSSLRRASITASL